MPHTDIKSDSVIIRLLPPVLHPYAMLARLDRPIGAWLLLLPGWWAIALASGGIGTLNGADFLLFLYFLLGAFLMRGAGCVVNDLWDRKLDAQVERTRVRPLASGTVRPWQALLFLLFLLMGGLVILLQLSPVTIMLGVLSLPLIALYPLMKRLTWWPQLFLGVVFNFGALMGWSAVTGVLGLPAIILYAAGICWTLGYDTIYAHQDKEDDMRVGIKSTALKFGPDSWKWITGFYLATSLLLYAAFITAGAGWLSLLLLAAPIMHGFWILSSWNETDPESSLMAFKASRNTGLLILLAALL